MILKHFKRALNGFSAKNYKTICQKIENTSMADCEHIIDDWIFNDLHRKMLKERLMDSHTLEEIAFDNDLSVTQTKKIILDGLYQITKRI